MHKRLMRSDRRMDPCTILLEFLTVVEECETLFECLTYDQVE